MPDASCSESGAAQLWSSTSTGSPSTVRDYTGMLQADSGVNFVLGQKMFGNLSFEQASSSLRLFAQEVVLAFAPLSAE